MSKLTLPPPDTWRWLLVNFPFCSDRFIKNLLIIGIDPAVGYRRAGIGIPRSLLDWYHLGAPLKPLLEIAIETLDEENLELFLKGLFRKKKAGKTEVSIDVAICYLDDTEKLTLLSSTEASKRLSSYLQQRGVVPYQFSADAYRKRIGRLRRKGVQLLCL